MVTPTQESGRWAACGTTPTACFLDCSDHLSGTGGRRLTKGAWHALTRCLTSCCYRASVKYTQLVDRCGALWDDLLRWRDGALLASMLDLRLVGASSNASCLCEWASEPLAGSHASPDNVCASDGACACGLRCTLMLRIQAACGGGCRAFIRQMSEWGLRCRTVQPPVARIHDPNRNLSWTIVQPLCETPDTCCRRC